MYIVDIISMDEKATQLQRASFDLFLKKKNRSGFSVPY